MIWQDIVISVVSFLFGFMLIPQLRDSIHGKVVNLYTAGLTTLGLCILAVTFISLQYWVTVAAELLSVVLWGALFVLSMKNKRKQKKIISGISSTAPDRPDGL